MEDQQEKHVKLLLGDNSVDSLRTDLEELGAVANIKRGHNSLTKRVYTIFPREMVLKTWKIDYG